MTADLQELHVESGTKRLRAALAMPAAASGARDVAGVLVLHESWGLNDDMREVCRRFAGEGYAAMAPHLLGDGVRKALCLTRLLVLRDHEETMADVAAALAHLGTVDGVDADRLGVIGFCLGGGFALAAGRFPTAKAVSVNYGDVPKAREVLDGVCPVVASYGATDPVFGRHASRLEAHLEALGVPHDVKRYDGAGHSFMTEGGIPSWMERLPNPLNARHEPVAAEDAWARTFAFFARHLG